MHALEAAELKIVDGEWDMEIRATAEGALELLNERSMDLVLTDMMLPGMSGLELLGKIQAIDRNLPVLLVTRMNTVQLAVEAMRRGAFDYVLKPVNPQDLGVRLHRAIRISEILRRQNIYENQARLDFQGGNYIGAGTSYQQIMRGVREAALVRSTVLITGETGTGKGLIARAIHEQSAERDKLFQVIDCATVPEGLMESELFGHVRGAFTGAIADKPGLIELANGGTVFLDEIGEMPLSLQAKLLRVLEDNQVRPVGGTRTRRVDMRFIAATNRNLEDLVREGKFRKDLYYRLAVISIAVPPLRDRREDIAPIASRLVQQFGREMGKPHCWLGQSAIQELIGYPFPGNVRELRNIIERSVMRATDEELTGQHIHPLLAPINRDDTSDSFSYTSLPYTEAKEEALAEFSRRYLKAKLSEHEGIITRAAESSGIPRQHFSLLMKKYLGEASEEA
jgi:DNA-binding NtrC family response regulator